ncbi:hypothetical protein BVI434_280009 [Burkholderia vietnamiensis]|nr:hypothetical protein BVI434_280009 [Burkholderia vietnamiensis]
MLPPPSGYAVVRTQPSDHRGFASTARYLADRPRRRPTDHPASDAPRVGLPYSNTPSRPLDVWKPAGHGRRHGLQVLRIDTRRPAFELALARLEVTHALGQYPRAQQISPLRVPVSHLTLLDNFVKRVR